MDVMPRAEDLHGGFLHAYSLGLVEVIGQFGVGPVGPVQALLHGPVDHPLLQERSEVGGEFGGGAGGLAGSQALEAAIQIGVEPALDGAGSNAKVGGNVLVRS